MTGLGLEQSLTKSDRLNESASSLARSRKEILITGLPCVARAAVVEEEVVGVRAEHRSTDPFYCANEPGIYRSAHPGPVSSIEDHSSWCHNRRATGVSAIFIPA